MSNAAPREIVAAGFQGDEATARRGLGAPDARARVVALGALARMGALDAMTLLAALHDESPAVRRRTIELAATASLDVTDASSLVDRLLDVLGGDDEGLSEVAAWCLGERFEVADDMAPDRVVAALSAAARQHADALVREAAVAALGSIGARQGLDAILAACDDKATVRRRAVLALAPFDGPAVDAALTRALDDRDWQVRQAAEDLRR